MPVASELSGLLGAFDEPAVLIRPEDRTVAAVNAAFSRRFGAFGVEGKHCWEAQHRACECRACGLACPMESAERTQKEAETVQTLYTSTKQLEVRVRVRPIFAADGRVAYWLERLHMIERSGWGRYAQPLVGDSAAHRRLMDDLAVAAASDGTTLIAGEKGVGKEHYARTLHANSRRAAHGFVPVAADTLTGENALERLLGGASDAGLMRLVGRGTLFIDDVASLSESVLRVLAETLQKGVYPGRGRAGGRGRGRRDAVEFRLVAGVSDNVGRFADILSAQNLLYVPPLRERPEDVEALARQFVRVLGTGRVHDIAPEALARLAGYGWPGNMHELRRVMAQAVHKAEEGVIGSDAIVLPEDGAEAALFKKDAPWVTLEMLQDRYLARAVREFAGSRAELARMLGLSERTFYRLAAQACERLQCRTGSVRGPRPKTRER
ncbi:MAG: sigma 54-interacting transcriptional regulator [Duodenibacillus sp.]